MDVDNLQNISLVKFDTLSVYGVSGILVDPLLKRIAISSLKLCGIPWGVADDNRHCEFVVLGQLKIWRRRVQSLDFRRFYCSFGKRALVRDRLKLNTANIRATVRRRTVVLVLEWARM